MVLTGGWIGGSGMKVESAIDKKIEKKRRR
jgi:hypothetical protein